MCPAGRYINATDALCDKCHSGRYSAAVNNATECTFCERGRYNNRSDSSVCTTCAKGRFNIHTRSASRDDCLGCPLGRISSQRGTVNNGSTYPYNAWPGPSCTNCSEGTFANVSGDTMCSECPSGTYGDSVQMTVCDECPVGRFFSSNSTGTESGAKSIDVCLFCVAGTFQDQTGLTGCKSCPVGHHTRLDAGLTRCFECWNGTFAYVEGTGGCAKCAGGKYAPSNGADVCLTCLANQYSGTAPNPGYMSWFPCAYMSVSVLLLSIPHTHAYTTTTAAGSTECFDCVAPATSEAGSPTCTDPGAIPSCGPSFNELGTHITDHNDGIKDLISSVFHVVFDMNHIFNAGGNVIAWKRGVDRDDANKQVFADSGAHGGLHIHTGLFPFTTHGYADGVPWALADMNLDGIIHDSGAPFFNSPEYYVRRIAYKSISDKQREHLYMSADVENVGVFAVRSVLTVGTKESVLPAGKMV
jgi:hypothetical protein